MAKPTSRAPARDLEILRRVDLNLLKLFAALCKTRNVSRAAETLGMGQPAASQSLGRLRKLFDDPLFVRSGQGVAPTPRAQALEGPIVSWIDAAAQILADEPIFTPAAFRGALTIGTSDYLELSIYAKTLAKLVKAAPSTRLRIKPIDRARAPDMIDEGDIDIALGFLPDKQAWHVREPLFSDTHVCIFNQKLLKLRTPLSLDDYISAPHVIGSLRGEFDSIIDERLAVHDRKRHVLVSTPHFLSLPFQVRMAPVIATLPKFLAEHCKQLIGLTISPAPLALPSFEVCMLWHTRFEQHGPHRWLRNLLRTELSAA